MQKHLEGHGGDYDHAGIFMVSFLQYGSFLCEWPASILLLSILCKSLTGPGVYGDVCSLQVSFDYIFVSQPLSAMKTFLFG